MKRSLLFVTVITLLLPVSLYAIDVTDFTHMVSNIQKLFLVKVDAWGPKIRPVALKLFISLLTIQIVLTGTKIIFDDRKELNIFFEEIVKLILMAGFLLWFISTTITVSASFGGGPVSVTTNYLFTIHESLAQLANSIVTAMLGGGTVAGSSLDGLGAVLNNFFSKLTTKMGEFDDWQKELLLVVVGSLSVIVITKALASAVKNYLFAVIAIALSPLIFAVAVLEYTRSWALNMITLVVKYNLKYMILILVIGLSLGLMDAAISKELTHAGMLAVLIMAMLMFEVVKGVEGLIEGLFSGAHHSSGTGVMRGLQRAVQTPVGAVAGAVGGYKAAKNEAVKTAVGSQKDSNGAKISSASVAEAVSSKKTLFKATAGAITGSIAGGIQGYQGKGKLKTMGSTTGKYTAKAFGARGAIIGGASSAMSAGMKITGSANEQKKSSELADKAKRIIASDREKKPVTLADIDKAVNASGGNSDSVKSASTKGSTKQLLDIDKAVNASGRNKNISRK